MEDELRETHFAALIVGTGLTQSIVAAALAAASYPIIHIDEQTSYGGPHASLSISDLAEYNLVPVSPPSPEVLSKSRQYALSLVPHLIPAAGPFVAALVNSGVARYGSFVLPKRVAVRSGEAGVFKSVPASKQDVFRDRAISLVQKRRLIKFLMFASGEFEGSPELSGKEQTPLLEFLSGPFGLSADLAEALAYAVAFCASPQDPTLPALIRTRSYLHSTGRYGPSPFLIGHYGGAGELAQGFCRTCAVRGGTYVLGRKVVSITREENKAGEESETTHRNRTTATGAAVSTYHPPSTFEGYGTEGVEVPLTAESTTTTESSATSEAPPATDNSTAPERPTGPLFRIQLEGFAAPFTASTLIGPEDWLNRIIDNPGANEEQKSTRTVRGIVIIDSPRTFSFDLGPGATQEPAEGEEGQEQETEPPRLDETLLVFPPSCGLGSEGVVTVLANGSATMSCPDGKSILYFAAQTIALDESPKEHLAPYVNAVLDACVPRPNVHLEVFYREQEISRVAVRKADTSAPVASDPRPTTGYTSMHLTEGADAAVQEAESVFWEVVGKKEEEGGVEFFARVAGADDDLDDF
ncbi:Rab proteins geranylgeranyltransferase component A [Ceratobasidium sp. AG-Ba]|nr:Rab proteins geranylgeranyltransferase component A [Ceratobasidium sp. AG-Ba]